MAVPTRRPTLVSTQRQVDAAARASKRRPRAEVGPVSGELRSGLGTLPAVSSRAGGEGPYAGLPAFASTGLHVVGLTKRYGAKVAVDSLCFDVGRGQVLGLLGPNGAGKTTTLLCLAGLLRPEAGEVVLEGRSLGPERSRLVALIPETPEVYGLLTVWEHLVFVAKSCGLGPEWRGRAEDLTTRLGLGEHLSSLGQELSKGLKQKTLIAASVLAGTPVIVLDEPMIGLDPAGQLELKSIVRELASSGVIVVLSTHLLESAQSLCSHVLMLKQGRVVATGALGELLAGRPLEELFLDLTR